MLSIGTKKYRNLQEQVAYNTECIKKLDDYLDGITIEDKLVVIESDSGTFTDEELVILSAPLAFISNGSRVWMKDSETLVEFVYKAIDIKATEVGSAYFEIGGSKIVVNRETGTYNTSSDTIITTYSKTQIDSIVANIMAVKADKSEVTSGLALKANVAGQAFTGGISAPEVLEVNTGYSCSKTEKANLTVTHIYDSICKTGNKITLVSFLRLKRTGDVADNFVSGVTRFNIPASIGSKIYPYTYGEGIVGTIIANQVEQAFSNSNVYIDLPIIFTKQSNTVLEINIYSLSSLTLDTNYIIRLEQTFLLSDNLAS